MIELDLPGLIVPSFLLGFCGGGFLVLLVSALVAVINSFRKIVSGRG